MLTVQYRMNKAIMQWSSDELYHGKLTAHPSVAEHTLRDMPPDAAAGAPGAGCKGSAKAAGSGGKKAAGSKKAAPAKAAAAPSEGTDPGSADALASLPVLMLVDTAGCGFEEQQEAEGSSYANPGEAKAVMAHVARLVRIGIPPQHIGIITPYNAQVGTQALAGAR